MIRLLVLVALATGLIPHAWAQTYPGQFPSGTTYGNSTGSAAMGFPMTGLQAESVLQFLQSGSGAVQRTLDSKLKDSVSVADFGASGSAQNTTGTISAISTSLALTSALDFVNGQGIRVNHAGAAFTIPQPTGCTATFHGTAGSTTYQYKVASLDAAGGVGAATALFSVASANATLGTNPLNYNSISCTAAAGASAYAIYKNISGTYTLIGVQNANTFGSTFNDYGQGIGQLGAPDFLPSTAQASSLADWLVTTIVSGAGTATLTLQTAATTAATTQGVYHDDTAALNNALAASANVQFGCGTFYVSSVLTVSAAGGAGLFGTNTICSILQKVSPTVDLFNFTGGPGNFITRLRVETSLYQAGGTLFDFQSGAGGNDRIFDVYTHGGYNVVIFRNGSFDFIDRFVFNSFNNNGINWTSTFGAFDTVTNGTLYADCAYNFGSGLLIQGGFDFMLSNLNVACEYSPIFIQPAASTTIEDIDIDHVLADGFGPFGNNSSGRITGINGWTLDGTNSGAVLERIRCTSCWGSTNVQHGFILSSVKGFSCALCEAYSNGQHGMLIFGSNDISIVAGKFAANSSSGTGSFDGIHAAGSSGKIMISSTQSGTTAAQSSVTQGYGIFSDNTVSNIILCNDTTLGNMTGGYSINGVTNPTCGNQ